MMNNELFRTFAVNFSNNRKTNMDYNKTLVRHLMMKNSFILTVFLTLLSIGVRAQQDSTVFKGDLYNNEYGVFMHIDFYKQDITIPGQELYGNLPGYLGKEKYSFCWPIVAVEVKGNKAIMTMVNDYGSEDMKAQLMPLNDSIFELKQLEGSTLKVPNNRKWQKLLNRLELRRAKSK